MGTSDRSATKETILSLRPNRLGGCYKFGSIKTNTKKKGFSWKRARKSHKGKQESAVRQIKQADLDMLEWAAAAGEIDLKYLDESGFCAWSELLTLITNEDSKNG